MSSSGQSCARAASRHRQSGHHVCRRGPRTRAPVDGPAGHRVTTCTTVTPGSSTGQVWTSGRRLSGCPWRVTGSSQMIGNRPTGTWSHSVLGKTQYGEGLFSVCCKCVPRVRPPRQEAGLGSLRSPSRAPGPLTGLNTRDGDSRASLWTSQHPVLGQEPDSGEGGTSLRK